MGFSRRVRGYVLFLPVINSNAWSGVSCVFVGSFFSVLLLVLILCVWMGNIAEIIVLGVEGARSLESKEYVSLCVFA